jgi:hypothetical protein
MRDRMASRGMRLVELRVVTETRHRPHIHDAGNTVGFQEVDEFCEVWGSVPHKHIIM